MWLLLVACGASHDDRIAPVTVTVDTVGVRDAGPRDAAPDVVVDAAVAREVETPAGEGWLGPRDATSLIGPAGAAVTGTPTTIVLVHSAAIRVDARSEMVRKVLLSLLPGWQTFMPYDVVDPLADVDWVLMAGSLTLGRTASNVFIAHHNLSEASADVAMATLSKRLPKVRPVSGFGGGTKAFVAFIDGADRLYVRPSPGVLAIVPAADGKRIAELLARVEVPADVRPGELVRIVDNATQRITSIPAPVQRARYWMLATTGGATIVRLEGDCASESDALAAAAAVRGALDTANPMMKMVFPSLAHVDVHTAGTAVRASASLNEDEVRFLGEAMSDRADATHP